tara:strand:- start:126 stop:683 length:558 start_codon:yes stop_codon:yes gene_type:complete
MVKIVLVKKTGELHDSVIKKHDLEDLCKKCGYRKKDNFKMHVNWAVTLEDCYYNIELYAKDTGRANCENKYDFPPPVDTLLFFGDCLLLNRDKEGQVQDLQVGDWEKIYEFLFGGFEDLDACAAEDDNEMDELADIPDSMKTKQGYLKDGFVIDDPEVEDSEETEETEEEDEMSELEEEEYEYDK